MTLYKHVFIYVGTLIALSACSTVQERQAATGGFEYLEESKSVSLQIPEGKHLPSYSSDYTLPELGSEAPRDQLGPRLSIISPQLVLPLVSGSHITEGSREATVWFDQIDDSQSLDETIWNSLLTYLEEQGIGVVTFDKKQQLLLSDWMIIEDVEDSPWYSWTKTERSVGQRFEFVLDIKSHGRTAALKVKLKDYLETFNEDIVAQLDESHSRRREVEVLNNVISHYAKQIRIADARRLRQIQQGLNMQIDTDEQGSAFVVNADYEIAWPRLLLVLRKLGFNVKDLDKSNGLLFVNYVGMDAGWWADLWGNADELPLDKKEYRLAVEGLGSKTRIMFQDNESNPLPLEIINDIYTPLAEIMATDDLDI